MHVGIEEKYRGKKVPEIMTRYILTFGGNL